MKYYIIIYDGITNNKKIQKCALVPVPPLLPAKSLGDDVHMTSALRGGGTGRNLTNGRVGSVDLVLTGNFLQTPFVYAPLKPKTDHA